VIRHRCRHVSGVSACQVYTCDGPFDAATTFWLLFATLRDTNSGSVLATSERKAGSSYLNPPVLAISATRSRLVVRSTGLLRCWRYCRHFFVYWNVGVEAGRFGSRETRDTQYAMRDIAGMHSVPPSSGDSSNVRGIPLDHLSSANVQTDLASRVPYSELFRDRTHRHVKLLYRDISDRASWATPSILGG
jgi:hypothetical protein